MSSLDRLNENERLKETKSDYGTWPGCKKDGVMGSNKSVCCDGRQAVGGHGHLRLHREQGEVKGTFLQSRDRPKWKKIADTKSG